MEHMNDLPALLGGVPLRAAGPPVWPPSDPDVLDALARAYHDGSWGKYHGGTCDRLQALLQEYHAIEHALLCGSGTYAVELALRSLKVGPGDEVLLADYDFPGNFLAVHALGAHPVVVDVAADNWNLGLDHLDEAVGPKTRVVLASHLHGGIVPMPDLMAWAAERKIHVVEDAAQCPGAIVFGRKAGTWGDVGVLSFGGSKLLTAGRGGAILTRHADIAQRARTSLFRGNLVCPLSELQAAVLIPQWSKLDQRNRRRLEAVHLLQHLLHVPGLTPLRNRAGEHAPGYYKVGLQFAEDVFGLRRDRFVAALRAEGIALDEGFHAFHIGRSPKRYRAGSPLTHAEAAHRGMVILHHPVLLEDDDAVRQVVQAIDRVHQYAGGLEM